MTQQQNLSPLAQSIEEIMPETLRLNIWGKAHEINTPDDFAALARTLPSDSFASLFYNAAYRPDLFTMLHTKEVNQVGKDLIREGNTYGFGRLLIGVRNHSSLHRALSNDENLSQLSLALKEQVIRGTRISETLVELRDKDLVTFLKLRGLAKGRKPDARYGAPDPQQTGLGKGP